MRRPARSLLLPLLVLALGGCQEDASRNVVSIEKNPAYQDPALLERAWRLPVAARYAERTLAYQTHLSFCGPASAVNALGSLDIATGDQEHVLDHTAIRYWSVRLGGMTLDELGELLRAKSGRPVEVLRDLDLAAFREHMRQSNRPDRRYVINFHRGPLFGRGGGHHSPIGGYLETEDLVFVLDVNERFKPWLVPTERLHAAMNTVDGSTGKKRGLLVVQ